MAAGYDIDCKKCGVRHDVDAGCPVQPCSSCAEFQTEIVPLKEEHDRIMDKEKLRVHLKHAFAGDPKDWFDEYQDGKISKGKLCENIAEAVQRYAKGEL